ncbi:MAG: response regulator [Candidatus Omnitrophica bacterium]|nr:response regulator [Candidatus Omnitrophota bacterium]MBI3083087.1 response regulator [Candidatus Omnitrophota bacterium]
MTPPSPEDDKKTIVVAADDDVDTLNVIKLKLEAHGFRVVTARDGQEAMVAVRQHQPALVILDVMMPRLNGFQVARMIKFDKRLKTTPVFLLTARTQEADHKLGTQVGANEYLTKPFDPQHLLDKIGQWLKSV